MRLRWKPRHQVRTRWNPLTIGLVLLVALLAAIAGVLAGGPL